MISINGIDFEPVPGCRYKHNYIDIVKKIKDKFVEPGGAKWDELSVYRALVLNDLWFLLYFGMGYATANHPFVVNSCREVEDGPRDFTLDVWAREHFKSAIITKAETIQFVLGNPNKSTGIFSYIKPLAKKFLFEIKETFDSNQFLNRCFPDVLWGVGKSGKEAPLWALDEGIVIRRKTNMSEPTVSAWGLTEGMPIGMHFDRRVYDDITTEDMAKSIDMLETVKTKFDSSMNIGKEGGHHRVIGTYYHHSDPLIYIRGKKDISTGKPKYHLRQKPATADGTANGKPVYFSQKRLDDLKGDRSFNFQQLLDPTPQGEQRLNPKYLNRIEPQFIPKGLFRFILVDQAGDLGSAITADGDSWAVATIGVEPVADDIGQARVFVEDLWISPASESEAIDQIVRMYLSAGVVQKLGVEKVGISTTHLHIAQALKARGRHVNFDPHGAGVLLRPAGRNKKKFIESALAWPLNNGKIFYSAMIGAPYIERLKMEMENFPLWHDDGLNVLAYVYDILKDFQDGFRNMLPEDEDERDNVRQIKATGASAIGGY